MAKKVVMNVSVGQDQAEKLEDFRAVRGRHKAFVVGAAVHHFLKMEKADQNAILCEYEEHRAGLSR